MLRLLDFFLSLIGLLAGLPLLAVLVVVGYFDTGSPLFRQVRVGRHEKPFTLIKLRTMRLGTASVASHLADAAAVTRLGHWLRRTKLDELPQLWNVLKGDMSLVGPRPGLFNQIELLEERRALGVLLVKPGITGLAQLSHIDMSTPDLLARTDARMLAELNLRTYLLYIAMTIAGRGYGDRIRQQFRDAASPEAGGRGGSVNEPPKN